MGQFSIGQVGQFLTGVDKARPNPPEEWVIEEVLHLRIINDDLWERVKARQA